MKEYKPKVSASSVIMRYAVMSICISCTCAYSVFSSFVNHASSDRIALLTVLFNIISVMGLPFFSCFADRVENKHVGVRLGVLLTVLGYYLPYQLGLNFKIVTLALGSCIFHAFASSLILSRSRFKHAGISAFLGGSALGLALYTYGAVFGHIATILLMVFAIPSDKTEKTDGSTPIYSQNGNPVLYAVMSALLVICFGLLSYAYFSFDLPWNTFFKDKAVFLAVIGIGSVIGGIISDLIGHISVSAVGFTVGAVLVYFCSDTKNICLVGLALLSAPIGGMISTVFRIFPKRPAFIFALFSAASYLGQEMTFYVPMKHESGIIIISMLALLCVILTFALPFLPKLLQKEDN